MNIEQNTVLIVWRLELEVWGVKSINLKVAVTQLQTSDSSLQTFQYFYRMKIDTKMVDNLAHLARLRFDEAEKESIRGDLEKMVAFVEKLQSIDTTGVPPLLHISDAANVLREDIVQGSITREEALLNAPVKDEAFFKVPKVIKK